MSTVNPHMAGRDSSKNADDSRQGGQPSNGAPARLCYVDDSRTSAYVVKRLLRPYGYVVDHFDSAEPALIALVKEKYDLLLTDLKVSPKGMDGDDLVRALRNSGHEKISSLPIIVITGATDEGILKEVYEAGANQILSKPVNGDELDSHIRNLVNGHSTSQADDTLAATELQEGNETENTSATVVPFGAESLTNKSSTIETRPVNDHIPVLGSGDETSASQDYSATASPSSERRILTQSLSDSTETNAPQPVISVKPASRVTPTIRVGKQPTADAPPAPTKTAAKRPGIKPAPQASSNGEKKKLTPEQIAARQKLLKAKALAKKRQQLAIAAKNQQLAIAAKNKAAESNKAKLQAKQKRNIDVNNIPTEHLSLEPREAEPVEVFNSQQTEQPTPNLATNTSQPAAAPQINIGGQTQEAVQTKAQTTSPSHAAQQTQPPPQAQATSGFQPDVEAASNILHEMERYPLVETDLSAGYTPSRVMLALGSILELYGPKKIITTILLLVAGYFLYTTWQEYFDEGLAVKVTPVNQGDIFQSITVPGKVVSKLRVNLTPAISGRLTQVYVEEGDIVKSGDLLARLDDREAKSFLKRAKASYESAREDVVQAQRSHKRLKQAFNKGAVAKKLVEEAEIELRSARARESVQEEEVRSAKLALENPRIVAPFSGTVTARYVEVGQWVVPSETLFTLIDEKQREVEVQVDAADSGGIAVGQTVTLSSDAFPGLQWNESVTRLAAATSTVGKANTVSVYISLGNNAPSLRFGQQVDADIRTAWNPNALKIPFGALLSKGGKSFVATINDEGKVQLVEVVTGIEDFSHVEILQGLNVGQSVILANGLDLRNNQKVYIASNN